MGTKTRIDREKENAESWKEGIKQANEQVQRVRVLCRAMTYAGEGLDDDDREKLTDLIDEMLQGVRHEFDDLTRFFSDIDRVGLSRIICKGQEA